MSRPRELVDELRAAVHSGGDDVAALIAEAREAARSEVVEVLRKLFVDDLLERALRTVSSSRRGLALVGVVRAADADGRVVRHGDLAALVTELAVEELDDPEAVERHVREHNDALLRAHARTAVVPMRFGTLLEDEAAVGEWLARNEEILRSELERLCGLSEWSLSIREPEPAAAEPVAVGAPESYLERRLAAGEESARQARLLAERTAPWHERLCATAEAAIRSRGRDVPLAAAYLVAESRVAEFHEALADVDAEVRELGLELTLVGPWPPFSFVTEALA
jgi:hypothetical protein